MNLETAPAVCAGAVLFLRVVACVIPCPPLILGECAETLLGTVSFVQRVLDFFRLGLRAAWEAVFPPVQPQQKGLPSSASAHEESVVAEAELLLDAALQQWASEAVAPFQGVRSLVVAELELASRQLQLVFDSGPALHLRVSDLEAAYQVCAMVRLSRCEAMVRADGASVSLSVLGSGWIYSVRGTAVVLPA